MATTESGRAFIFKESVNSLVYRGSYRMRCYFMRDGHIEAVEELPGLSDEQAIARAHALYAERKHLFEGFELWDRARVIIRHPEPVAASNVAVWPLHRALGRTGVSQRQSPRLKPSPER
jgi:hypothetical protein